MSVLSNGARHHARNGHSAIRLAAAVLACVGVWLVAQRDAAKAAPPAKISAPVAYREASQPSAGWHYWTRCELAQLVAHETGGLWFAVDPSGESYRLLWRYDLKTGRIRVLSMLDGLEAITGDNALVPGKDCVSVKPLSFAGRTFLPGSGWTALPQLAGGTRRVVLRPNGTALCKEFIPGMPGRIFEWTGEWTPGVTLPSNSAFVPVADGYLLFGTGNAGVGIPICYDLEGKPRSASPVGGAQHYDDRWYRVGSKTYVVLLRTKEREEEQILYDATSGKLAEEARGFVVGPDLAGKGVLFGRVVVREGNLRQLKITLPEGTVIETPLVSLGRCGLFRDVNGHVWLNARRWDGRKWELVVPREHHFPLPNYRAAMYGHLAALDPSGRCWVEAPAPAGRPANVIAFEPTTETAWTLDNAGPPPFKLHLRRRTGDAWQTLHTVPTFSPYHPDFILDGQGQWWWMGYDPKVAATRPASGPIYPGVLRLAGDKAHFYPTRHFTSGFSGYLFHGPSKSIWLCDADGWASWDPKADKFIVGEPWEEFAFAFGPWTLSLVGQGSQGGLPATGQRGNVRTLRRKEGGTWRPLPDPFGQGELDGVPGMVRQDRMLVSSRQLGVLEYDVTRDRWELLHSYSEYDGFFDAAGRRLLACDNNILGFDADPFGDTAVDPATAREQAEFSELLKLIDSDQWRVRDQATQEMKKRARTHVERLRAALKGQRISLEVRLRIEAVLEETGLKPDLQQLKRSLFDRMHPPPPERQSVPMPSRRTRGDPTPGRDAGG